MVVTKLEHYKKPSYPDKDTVLHNPILLKKLPERWRRSAYTCATLSSVLLLLLTACKTNDIKSSTIQYQVPFFEHGDGRGSFGCQSVAPPAFLSEEEALSVINEITKREGFEFTKYGATLNNIQIPETSIYDSPIEDITSYKKGDLTLDGFNSDKKIAFEFISKEDLEGWVKKSNKMSSVSSYAFKNTAKALSEKLNEKNKDMIVATFYDPQYTYDEVEPFIYDFKMDSQTKKEKLVEIVKADLRLQVQDFISWLKAQNII